MGDADKTEAELIAEIGALRARVEGLNAREPHAPVPAPVSLRLRDDRVRWREPQLRRVSWQTDPGARERVRDARESLRPIVDPFANGLPWAPLEAPRLREGRVAAMPVDQRLATVGQQPKVNVRRIKDVPEAAIATSGIRSVMERPRSLDVSALSRPWFDQLTTAFLLHVEDGFVGDGVVFDAERYYAFGKWWLGWNEDSWKLYEGTREVRHVEAAVSIAAWGGEAFQHFVVDCMPKLASVIGLLEDPAFKHVQIVSHAEEAPAAQWFWRRLGLSHRVVQKPRNAETGFVVHADHALFPDFAPSLGQYGLYPRDCLRPIQQRLGVLDPVVQDRVVYLRRTGKRSVANEARLLGEIHAALAGSGCTLTVFEASGDLDRDMAEIQRAKVIVGPHGGAFANLVFAQPGTRVVEFNPLYRLYAQGRDPKALYWGLAQAAGLDYWTVEPRNFAFEGGGMWVDVADVVHLVRDAIFEPPGPGSLLPQ